MLLGQLCWPDTCVVQLQTHVASRQPHLKEGLQLLHVMLGLATMRLKQHVEGSSTCRPRVQRIAADLLLLLMIGR